jgi:hypothetical protein
MMKLQRGKYWAHQLVNARHPGAQEEWQGLLSDAADQAAAVIELCNGYMLTYDEQQLAERLADVDPSDTAAIAAITAYHNHREAREWARDLEFDQWLHTMHAESRERELQRKAEREEQRSVVVHLPGSESDAPHVQGVELDTCDLRGVTEGTANSSSSSSSSSSSTDQVTAKS